MTHDFDVIIVGAGFVGLTLAFAYCAQGMRVALIESKALSEKKQQQAHDGRAIALSRRSVQILEALNIWPYLASHASPIKEVCVSEQGGFGKLYLTAQEQACSALGYVIAAPLLGSQLLALCEKQNNITWFSPAMLEQMTQNNHSITAYMKNHEPISAELMIVAEGTESLTRVTQVFSTWTRDYKQYAIVANLSFNTAKLGIAYQRFTKQGTLALLPLTQKRYTLVWTVSEQSYPQWQALSDQDFLEKIQAVIGSQLGTAYDLGPRQAYPLKAVFVEKAYDGRLLLMGNAAHTLNPIAAQGFNLTLRDIECLLKQTSLSQYQDLRLSDQRNMLRFTDSLVNLSSMPVIKHFRGLGLGSLNYLPFAKRRLFEHLLGY